MVKVKLEKYEVDDKYMCTDKQFKFIVGLMSKTKHEEIFLNKIAFGGKEKLTISEASKLIDCLLKKKEFEIIDKQSI